MENTSGMGAQAQVPPEVRGWNWGAFFFNWIWGLFNNTLIALLTLVPCVGWVMAFILGAKGSEWAWRNKRWESVERFKQVQRNWAWAGLGLMLFWVLFAVGMVFFTFAVMKQSDAYKVSLEMIRADQRAIALIGQPIEEAGLVVTGNVNTNGDNGRAEISYKVKGPKGEAKVFFKAQKVLGQWEVQRLVLQQEGTKERIDLTPVLIEKEESDESKKTEDSEEPLERSPPTEAD